MDATASSVAASTGRGRGAAAAGARGAAGGAAGVAAITNRSPGRARRRREVPSGRVASVSAFSRVCGELARLAHDL